MCVGRSEKAKDQASIEYQAPDNHLFVETVSAACRMLGWKLPVLMRAAWPVTGDRLVCGIVTTIAPASCCHKHPDN